MKILGLIPARGGSKGIPDKNKKLLGGKPLLQYTMEAALASKHLDKVVFSSEDAALIDLAKSMGVEVPFVRPAHLSGDTSGSLEVVQHALNFFLDTGESFDAVCLLQVTTPFRTASDIDSAIEKFISERNDALISVQKVPHQYNPHWVFTLSEKGDLQLASGDIEIIKRRQDLPEAFIRDGAIYITKTDVLLKEHSFFGQSLSYFETNAARHVNIDTPEDWERAEQLCKKLYF
ncbi:N-acylneuraminate cytidylyltransferase [Ulvibacter sp. MAR_2010_11]|uniref:acylneuraminate cytidylyltransferase family protein n=1 Tax=Ulvibacter sp. MAR_2010_11 TaxID=1250229 RepID=UPI000C2CC276|nr:acylneuraminate cytidylyltransferase family protein [Ulvibacter sp. MAR_2010_11]PKA82114.1 N-acylneuraminate cytidylyltransferase [Ulvibacter sp. MAR_2010_11]